MMLTPDSVGNSGQELCKNISYFSFPYTFDFRPGSIHKNDSIRHDLHVKNVLNLFCYIGNEKLKDSILAAECRFGKGWENV